MPIELQSTELLLKPFDQTIKKFQLKPIVADLQAMNDFIDTAVLQLTDLANGNRLYISLYPNASGNPNVGSLSVDGTGRIFSVPQANGFVSGKIIVIVGTIVKVEGVGYSLSDLISGNDYKSVTFVDAPDTGDGDTVMFVYISK